MKNVELNNILKQINNCKRKLNPDRKKDSRKKNPTSKVQLYINSENGSSRGGGWGVLKRLNNSVPCSRIKEAKLTHV